MRVEWVNDPRFHLELACSSKCSLASLPRIFLTRGLKTFLVSDIFKVLDMVRKCENGLAVGFSSS